MISGCALNTPDEIAAFRRVLAALINTLPERDDLWKQLSTSCDTQLDRLRSLIERLMGKDSTVMKEYLTLQRKKQAF